MHAHNLGNPTPGSNPPADLAELQERYDKLRSSVGQREQIALKRGFYEMGVKLVSIIDDFDRALESMKVHENDQSSIHGVEVLRNQVLRQFADVNLHPFGIVGETFDPNVHDAVAVETGMGQDNSVIKVIKRGWKYNDEVIRVASVVVLKSEGDAVSLLPAVRQQPVFRPPNSGPRRRNRSHVNKRPCPYGTPGCYGECPKCRAAVVES